VIHNLAALSHAAYRKVRGRPSLPELSSVFLQAVERLCVNSNVPPSVLSEKVQWRMENLKEHFRRWRTEAGMIRKFKEFVRGIKRVVVP
jgi:hypothetical protein